MERIEPRMDGTLEQALAWRIKALREALANSIIEAIDGSTSGVEHTAGEALDIDDENRRVTGVKHGRIESDG